MDEPRGDAAADAAAVGTSAALAEEGAGRRKKNTRGGVWGSFGRFWGRREAPGALGGARGRLVALGGAWERSGALRVLGGRSAAPGSLRPRSGALGGARGRAVARAFPACE